MAVVWEWLTQDALGWARHTTEPHFCPANCWVCSGKTTRSRVSTKKPRPSGRYYLNVWRRKNGVWVR